jgi:hypothetical protein
MSQFYVGTKIVEASPQEKDGVDGYAVKYADGYTSWSPADTFRAAYLPLPNISNLPPHIQRVHAEAAELKDRLTKLDTFIMGEKFDSLPGVDRSLLRIQASAMRDYLNVLTERLEHFNPTTATAMPAS